ncbi:MAG: ImmA/IrrE family metallo-endopeptidase [Gemmatimonadetes bacterium]|nr:ImmA/IrrE family metallo-endopeptidase [Gemmatimonadota bacterium]
MPINARLLTLAREARELSQTTLAERAGLSQALLSRFENGLREPSDEQLAALASHLNYPASLFQQPDEPVPLPLTFHRKRAKLSKTAQDRIHAQMNFAVMHVERLLRSVELDTDLELRPADPEEFGSAANIARSLRAFWQVPHGPVGDLAALAERAGVVVIVTDIGTDDLSGFSVWKHGGRPLVLVNARKPADHQRHTLAHELGHIVMHHRALVSEATDIEKQADEFAAEFLMPEADIRPQLEGRIDLAKLAALKPVWRVSIASLLMRAGTLGLVSTRYRTYLWMMLGRSGYRQREPQELDFPPERPHLLRDLFEYHVKELGYSEQEIGALLHHEPNEIRAFYFNTPTAGLRMVT